MTVESEIPGPFLLNGSSVIHASCGPRGVSAARPTVISEPSPPKAHRCQPVGWLVYESILFQADSALLRRILINMLMKALEASGTGQTVTATCIHHFPERVRFSVHNDTAMPDSVQSHVFQRSFSTKASGAGWEHTASSC